MKIKITFRDFREPLKDVDEQEIDKRIDQLSVHEANYMDLRVFLEHLRAGKFGEKVKVTFKLTTDGEYTRVEGRVTREAPMIIQYTIASDDAPSETYLEGLL